MFAEAKKRRDEKQAALESLNYTFSPAISFDDLSCDEIEDLSALAVGEATYIFGSGDVTRSN